MKVSIIIPAYNAQDTISETLESLIEQDYPNWEAIVVDDGSSDQTYDTAMKFCEKDTRIRLVTQANKGEAGARNTGIDLARSDWLLFLDADDWILPQYLELMTRVLKSDPSLDAVNCSCVLVGPDGKCGTERYFPLAGDIFSISARLCPFAIHTCVVRRSLVEDVGGFDTSLRTCPEWDLWQRIARTGARVGTIRKALAHYRMRPNSAGVNGPQILADGLRIIARGHAPDPRVQHPDPAYANGLPVDQLSGAILTWTCWPAGVIIGRGDDARPLLEAVKDYRDPDLNLDQAAKNLFHATLLPDCRLPEDCLEILPRAKQRIDEFLVALEAQSMAPNLTNRTWTILERLILDHSSAPRPLTVGSTHGLQLEITESIPDVCPPNSVERLHIKVKLEAQPIGTVELPICDGFVSRHVISDSIAAELSWPILGLFFERTVYRDLRILREPGEISIFRGSLCLAKGLKVDDQSLWQRVHESVGWTVFLQELWGRPDWWNSFFYWDGRNAFLRRIWGSLDWPKLFYSRRLKLESSKQERADDGWIMIELNNSLPDVEVSSPELNIIPTVGGAPLGLITIPVNRAMVRAQEIGAAITRACGFDLCRVAVREGLLGRPISCQAASLRERLDRAAASREDKAFEKPDLTLIPEWVRDISRGLPEENHLFILGRRNNDSFGTSASRRMSIPSVNADELIKAAIASEPIMKFPEKIGSPALVLYVPEIIEPTSRKTKPTRILSETGSDRPNFTRRLRSFFNVGRGIFTDQLPILLYHRIGAIGSPSISRYNVTPEAFKEQLSYLNKAGFRSVSLDKWRSAMMAHEPLDGRAVLITFDDGYLDFLTHAWPLLKRYGFSATVFLVADEIGRTNGWDHSSSKKVPLLGWKEIRQLQDEGIEFGSHSASHCPLTALTSEDVVREGILSKTILQSGLGRPVTAIAYPYAAEDRVVQHLIGGCGYVLGLSSRNCLSTFHDSLLSLPRIEVGGTDNIQTFIKKLNP